MFLIFASFSLTHCVSAPKVVQVPHLRQQEALTPVVFVPGVLGSRLRHQETGQVLWGKGTNVLWPRDGGYNIALPITADGGGEDPVEAIEVLDQVGLFGIRRVVYKTLVDLMTNHGYRFGSLDDPGPDESFFLFAYDWRQSNIESTRELIAALERLRRARGDDVLAVNLVCQSNGAYICRYLLKYGSASLDEAEAGLGRRPATLDVERLVLVGTSNGGSLRTLRELNRGRRYLGVFGRQWFPETLFTVRALFQDLPSYDRDLFLDERGEAMAVDLFDANAWQRYGWSIFGRKPSKRLDKKPRPDLFADAETRLAYLRRVLDDARRLHDLLARDADGFGGTRYHLIQDIFEPSPEQAVLIEHDQGWQTLFTGDRTLRDRADLHAKATGPGDGHATVESQLWLSPQEHAALDGEQLNVPSSHAEIIFEPAVQERLLELFAAKKYPRIAGETSRPASTPISRSTH